MKIENAFDVPASPDDAWSILSDVAGVLPCMPGAELEEAVDERTFRVLMRVKLGAVALALRSTVVREQVDEATRTTVLRVDARDEKGRGGASGTVVSSLEPAGEGTRVTVATDVQLRGPLASMGRGVVAAVAGELSREFAERLSERIRTGPEPAAADAQASTAAPQAISGFRLLLRALAGRLRRA